MLATQQFEGEADMNRLAKVPCVLVMGLAAATGAWAQTAERQVIDEAATALGGKDRIQAVRTLRIIGYGQLGQQDGGGNIVSTPDAPQKWTNINAHQRVIDFSNNRMNVQQRNVQDFVFAYARNMTGQVRINQSLDGNVAFNTGTDGKAARVPDAQVRTRRLEMLNNPVSLIRTALDPAARLSNLRTRDKLQLLDLTTPQGDHLVLALDRESRLPAWVSWVAPHTNYGDTTYRTHYVGYQALDGNGLVVPFGYNTVIDFRDVVQQKLYVDKYVVDGPADNLAAPAEVRSAAAPVPVRPAVEAIPVGKGVWFLKATPGGNSTLFEFSDHLVLYEAYGSEANALAVIEKARATVPGKPLTHLILSHHHIDHTGGLRAAVSEGLTIITNRQHTDFIREVTSRPARLFPDALGRNPRTVNIVAVDDHLKLKDSAMEVDLYRVINNNHMAYALVAYVAAEKVVAQGDLIDEGWDIVWWGNSYPDTVAFWQLDVARDLPVHGNINTYPRVIELLKEQTANAQKLCAAVDAANLNMQGCPVANTL